jgi:hypothetical protein
VTRGHRTFHLFVWPALALAVAFGFTMALVLRPPAETSHLPPAQVEPAK